MVCILRSHVTTVISVACVAPKGADETSKDNKRIRLHFRAIVLCFPYAYASSNFVLCPSQEGGLRLTMIMWKPSVQYVSDEESGSREKLKNDG